MFTKLFPILAVEVSTVTYLLVSLLTNTPAPLRVIPGLAVLTEIVLVFATVVIYAAGLSVGEDP